MHYDHAPIIEAALDVFVRLPQGVKAEDLERAHEGEEANYPVVKTPLKAELQIANTGKDGFSVGPIDNRRMGYAFYSSDGRDVFQARLDGFTHNRLAPYADWQSLRSEAARLWSIYKGLTKPDGIELIGLHYANVLDVPVGKEMGDYFRAYVSVPDELPQQLESFAFNFEVPYSKYDARLRLMEMYVPPRQQDMASILLDIRVWRQIAKGTTEYSDGEMWEAFEKLHLAKNEAFEACITNLTREMIK